MSTVKGRMEVLQGHITKLAVDAIVNAANRSLMRGGGVDGAIHRAGGPAILEECKKIREKQGGCPTGEAVITTAGRLPAKYVIHTVGPVWRGGKQGEEQLLRNCYRNSLRLALEHGVKTIAFPNISTGVYGYPKREAAEAAVDEVAKFLSEDTQLEKVIFVCFNEDNYEIYRELYEGLPG